MGLGAAYGPAVEGVAVTAGPAPDQLSLLEQPVAGTAVLSPDGTYRYQLSRRWGTGGRVAWIMLNPSTADAVADDPTVRRCVGFARRWGFDGIDVVNLFALRATDPAELDRHPDPVGPDNLRWVRRALAADLVVAGWGAQVAARRHPRLTQIAVMLAAADVGCLGVTKSGAPRHPLYVSGDTDLILWRPS